MAIYAGAPMAALIMGIVTEAAKLVTTSWLYRNWKYSSWKLKLPLIYFTLALMTATSIGVYGFLSKAHLEQGAGTLDNSSKIESLQYQIDREKTIIADNEKVVTQLDGAVNSLIGKDRADRSISVRRSQAPQRKQLRDDITVSQKKIDELSSEKFKLESEVRKLELEVGPIRYIAELFYGADGDTNKDIEAAVRIFTLLLVSTLDPLAVILLIAANHTLIRLRNEKDEKTKAKEAPFGPDAVRDEEGRQQTTIEERSNSSVEHVQDPPLQSQAELHMGTPIGLQETTVPGEVLQTPVHIDEEAQTTQEISEMAVIPAEYPSTEKMESAATPGFSDSGPATQIPIPIQDINEKEDFDLEKFRESIRLSPISFAKSPGVTPIFGAVDGGHMRQFPTLDDPIQTTASISVVDNSHWNGLEELTETIPHFVPQKINEEETNKTTSSIQNRQENGEADTSSGLQASNQADNFQEMYPETSSVDQTEKGSEKGDDVIPTTQPTTRRGKYSGIGWIDVFKGAKNERQ